MPTKGKKYFPVLLRRPKIILILESPLLLDTAYSLYANEPHGWTDTVIESMDDWPSNLLLCWAFSASKSHTIYGLRCGALIMAHPNREFLDRMVPMLVHTGRGTWSGSPRMPQAMVSKIHNSSELESSWDAVRAGLSEMLIQRRTLLLEAGKGLPFDPSHDGYFAHISDPNPVELCEEIAAEEYTLYLYRKEFESEFALYLQTKQLVLERLLQKHGEA